jgi:hypothetical protein
VGSDEDWDWDWDLGIGNHRIGGFGELPKRPISIKQREYPNIDHYLSQSVKQPPLLPKPEPFSFSTSNYQLSNPPVSLFFFFLLDQRKAMMDYRFTLLSTFQKPQTGRSEKKRRKGRRNSFEFGFFNSFLFLHFSGLFLSKKAIGGSSSFLLLFFVLERCFFL